MMMPYRGKSKFATPLPTNQTHLRLNFFIVDLRAPPPAQAAAPDRSH